MVIDAGEHHGGCHCGGVRFTAIMPEDAMVRRCNCSICAKKGVVMVDVPLANLTIDEGEELLRIYRFNTGQAKHYFCSHCGIHTFHQTRSDADKYGVNASCLDGVNPHEWPEVPVFDGQNHPGDTGGVTRYAGTMRYEPSDKVG